MSEALRWDLADFYRSPDDPKLTADLQQCAKEAQALSAAYRGKVASLDAKALAKALGEFEAFMQRLYQPSIYASLLFSGQTQDPAAQALLDRTREESTNASNEVKFFDLELKALPDALFEKLVNAPELASYRHHLLGVRRFAPYTLSEDEEKLADLKSLTGRSAFVQLYTEVSSRLRVPVEVDGAKKELTVAEARALRSSPDRALRRRATDGLMTVFEANSHVLNFCFNTLFQDHALDVKLRGYPSVTEPTYLEDELSTEVVENLMSTTERHYGLCQRYMKLKARAMGLTDFSSHDVLAPIGQVEKKIPFPEGRQLVLDSFRAFEPKFAGIAQEFFDKRWIDVLPRQGKRDGAFCSGGLPNAHPYVLLNYNERLEDVSTLAHELGHGIHFYLSRRNSLLNFWATTPMAETASVFGELLLMKRLLESEKDKEVRKGLLALRIEDILATVFSQVSYTRWEQKAHARRAEGVTPAEDFAKLWMDERVRLYGDSVRFLPQDRWGWIGIGHFVSYRFYCYSYAFGQLLVLALFRKYEEEGSPFIPRYVELLSSGCADTPQALLARVGIDLTDSQFWARGFQTLAGLMDEFEALL